MVIPDGVAKFPITCRQEKDIIVTMEGEQEVAYFPSSNDTAENSSDPNHPKSPLFLKMCSSFYFGTNFGTPQIRACARHCARYK